MKKVLIVGCGNMASEYAKVLTALNIYYEVIGNRPEKIHEFSKKFPDVKIHQGGYKKYLLNGTLLQNVIIATNANTLFEVTESFLKKGAENILVEKPAGFCQAEIDELVKKSDESGSEIIIGYNRRFYQSIKYAKEIIKEDGGISSVHFEFTEWVHTFDLARLESAVLGKLVIGNSSHVIDTVFHLSGRPKELFNIVKGNVVKWHPGSIFCGCGITENEIPFTYHSDWGAPGRWSIEILTLKHRLYLKPMERLSIQVLGSVKIEEPEKDYNFDIEYKPGLFLQTQSFLYNYNKNILCSIQEHQQNFPFYEKIAGYVQ